MPQNYFTLVRLEIIHASRIRCWCCVPQCPEKLVWPMQYGKDQGKVSIPKCKREAAGTNPSTSTFLFHLCFSPELTGLWEKLPPLNPDTKTAEQTENSQIFLTQKVFQKHFQVENSVPAQLKISMLKFQFCGRKKLSSLTVFKKLHSEI